MDQKPEKKNTVCATRPVVIIPNAVSAGALNPPVKLLTLRNHRVMEVAQFVVDSFWLA
jgi:hypothetical protein